MTVAEFSELIVEMLGQQTHDKIEDRVVLALADSLRGSIIGELYSLSGSPTGEFIKRFKVDIQFEDGQEYIDLPCQICTIPNSGAFQFVGPEDEETNYVMLKHTTIATISNLEIGALAGRTGYFQEGRRLYFRYLPIPNPPKILLKLVPSLVWMYENTPDEELMSDATLEALLIEKCFAALGLKAKTQEDKTADE